MSKRSEAMAARVKRLLESSVAPNFEERLHPRDRAGEFRASFLHRDRPLFKTRRGRRSVVDTRVLKGMSDADLHALVTKLRSDPGEQESYGWAWLEQQNREQARSKQTVTRTNDLGAPR